ncbi:MAG: hypothetical protein WD398_06820 [Cyclobacteriaceae bacterium]
MTRFVFRNVLKENPNRSAEINSFGGAQIMPFEAAQFTNSVQELAENTRLGIHVLFKSNAGNHMDFDAIAGINVESGSFSSWPKESGLAATRDMELIADFAKTMAREWTAIGLAPFQAAIDAGASSIMAYYVIPVNQPYLPNNVGMAFSKGILTDLG